MREILFRGKRKDNGEWIFGDLMQVPTYNFYSIIGQTACAENNGVIPETVGQYTGFTDKNGVPMYEGDIIKNAVSWQEKYRLAWVGFKDGSFGLFWNRGEVIEFNPFTSLCNVTYEIIGNIHDNPELITQEATI